MEKNEVWKEEILAQWNSGSRHEKNVSLNALDH